MSRSAADATRFTATSLHAYAKPTPINRASPSTYPASSTPRLIPSTRLNPNARTPPPPLDPQKGIRGNAPLRETPAEKVARLREARLRERAEQITTWDRVVVRGRVWADRAHKATVLSLVAFSMLSVSIAAFSLTDMILHNRRKRAAFYAEQHAIYASRLVEAVAAERAGVRPLDDDQTLVLNRERARIQADEAARERTWGKRVKRLFIGGLKTGEEAEAEGAEVVVPSEAEILQRLGVGQRTILERARGVGEGEGGGGFDRGDDDGRGEKEGSGGGLLQAVADKRREGERVYEAAGGGPLDRMAEGASQAVEGKINTAEAKVGSGGGWTSWWTGK